MSPVNPDEGNPTPAAGAADPSTSQTSAGNGQPLPELVATIMSRLDEQDKFMRGLQKGTDKQIGQVRSDVKRILELKDKGLTEEQIQRELSIDELLGQNKRNAETAPDKGGGSNGFDIGSIDNLLELPANDARVTDLKLKYGNDLASYLREGMKLKSQLSTNPPTPAEMPLPPGKAPSADTAAQIEKGYLEEAAKVQRGNVFQLNEVKKKWRAKAREAGLQLNV